MDPLLFMLVYSSLAILPWMAAIVIAIRRSRMAPVCGNCGARKVIRTSAHRLRDILPALSLMVPLRCMGCLARTYGLRGVGQTKGKHVWESLSGEIVEDPVRVRRSFFSFPQWKIQVRVSAQNRVKYHVPAPGAFQTDLDNLQNALRPRVRARANRETSISR